MEKVDENLYFVLSMITALAVVIVLYDKKKMYKIKKDFEDPIFFLFFIIISLITIWGLNSTDARVKFTVINAMVAFMISFFARLGMFFSTFFLVGAFVYYTNGK